MMEKFETVTGIAAPMLWANVDTDMIIPVQRLVGSGRQGLGPYGFERFRGRPDFPLDRPPFQGAPILLAGENFGCGSSREGAVWTLMDMGLRCVIAPSFGDIFHGNALKNALLPVVLPLDTVRALQAALRASPGAQVRVDLVEQRVQGPGIAPTSFAIDSFARRCLLEGLDEIDYTLTLEGQIARFEKEMNP
jgi:3-isopropylmalate/(R)-2-methylmalate dehydratase small subunit